MADYQVDPEALKSTAKGINDAIGELKAIGFAETAGLGRGFDNLELTGVQIGDPGCKSAFDDFCERWGEMVRGLVQEGNEIAGKLNLSAGIYHDQEQYLSGTLKDVANAAMGNPDLTQDQVESQSWGKTLSDNQFTQVAGADYSEKSFEAAALHSASSWKLAEADMLKNNPEFQMLGDPIQNAEQAAKAEAYGKKLNAQSQALGGGK